ncbi:SDN1 [Symbiodinium sp. CCMP2592]|nr:SDN1 [Symbiodinium sp. CCMP2592]
MGRPAPFGGLCSRSTGNVENFMVCFEQEVNFVILLLASLVGARDHCSGLHKRLLLSKYRAEVTSTCRRGSSSALTMAAVPVVLCDITNQASAPDGCDLLYTPETLRTPTRKPFSLYFTEDDSEMYEQNHRVPQSGRPSTSGCRALSEGSCLRRSSVGKSQARRTSILELGPEERMRALGVRDTMLPSGFPRAGACISSCLCGLSELPRWQKALIAGGGLAVAGAGLYIAQAAGDVYQVEDVDRFYQVVDPDMGINLRAEPDTFAAGTAYVLIPGEAFHVSRVIRHGGQEYLSLSDGRGWAFTRSKAGAIICERCTEEEVQQAGGTALDQVEAMLRSNLALCKQLEASETEDSLRQMAKRVLLAKEEMPS